MVAAPDRDCRSDADRRRTWRRSGSSSTGPTCTSGRAPERTRKFLNVKAGQAKVALVVDDLVSTDPWTPRGLRVYGSADLIEREGMFGPGAYMRITPEISWSWNLAGQPYGSGSPRADRPLIIPNGPGACPAAAPSSPGPEECAPSRGWDRSWMIRP